jgi:hypothetical protein
MSTEAWYMPLLNSIPSGLVGAAVVYYFGLRQRAPICVIVPDEDFAIAFADFGAIEPIASRPSVVFDSRREFWLSCPVRHAGAKSRIQF